MRPYLAILSARFRALLQYRAAAAAGFATQVFWGFIRVMIFAGFYHSTTSAQPMSYEQIVTFVWLGQAMLTVLPWGVDPDVRAMIRSGTVVYELLRPVDLYALWFSRSVSQRIAPMLLRATPMFVLAGLFFGLKPPDSFASGVAWVASTACAVMLSAAITTLFTISLLWTISGEGIVRLVPCFVNILSGMIVPIPLMPGWAQVAMNALPFRGLADTPFRLYMGHIPPAEALPVLAGQLVWTAVLVLLGRAILARGVRRLVAQGG